MAARERSEWLQSEQVAGRGRVQVGARGREQVAAREGGSSCDRE